MMKREGLVLSMVRKVILYCLRFYQRSISPVTPGTCRFRPSCSEYAVQAVQRHGAMRGAYLTVRRVLRCHPLGSRGFDPVP